MAIMKWLRLYHEARTDAKLESLPNDEFRVWFRLLCFAGEQLQRGVITGFSTRLLAAEVARGDVALLERTLTSLQELRIIECRDDAGGGYAFAKWNNRQYDKPSDMPDRVADRVAAHRDRHRNADVTPRNAPVTRSNATEEEEEEDAEQETEQEEEQDPSADVAGVVTPRARGRAAPSVTSKRTSISRVPLNAVTLCEQIAEHTHLPQRPDVLEHLGAVIDSHLARGLSPGDIWRDVLNLTDPSREKHIKRPSVSQLSNWLAHTHPADDLAALVVAGASNGHRPSNHTARGEASNGHHARRQRQPDLPDSTQHGQYAHLIAIASDDDPDDS